MKKRMNKKGFTLVEVLVCVAILGILTALLAPSLMSSREDTRMKSDETAIVNLETTVHMALQNSEIYYMSRDIVDDTETNELAVVYKVNNDGVLVMDSVVAITKSDGYSTSNDATETGEQLKELKTAIEDYVNGSIEPITIQTEFYRERQQCFYAYFTEIDFKVILSTESGTEGQSVTPANRLGSVGMYNGAYKQDGKWFLPQLSNKTNSGCEQLHIHTGSGGLDGSSAGDIWKIVLTGENLEGLDFRTTYHDGSRWVNGGAENIEIVKNGNSYEIYIRSTTDYSRLALCFWNDGSETAVIDSTTFSKVDSEP